MRIDDDGGIRVQFLDEEGPILETSEQTSDLIGNAWYEHVDLIAVPVVRLTPEFFRLRSQFAGEFIQKFVNYRLKLAVIGDVSEFTLASDALRDFVWESNRGEHVWFLPDEKALADKLEPRRAIGRAAAES